MNAARGPRCNSDLHCHRLISHFTSSRPYIDYPTLKRGGHACVFWRGVPAAVNSSDICPLSVFQRRRKVELQRKIFRPEQIAQRSSGRRTDEEGVRPSASVVRVGPFALPELIWHTAAHASSSSSRRRWGFSSPSLPSFEGWRGRHACHAMLRPRLTEKECRFRLQKFRSCLVHQAVDEQNCR